MPFLNGFLWTLVFSVGASHFPSPLVSSGLALELPGTAGLLSSPYTHHLSSQWASRGSAPEDLKGLMWLANQEFRASSRDLQPLLPAGLLGLSIQQLTHLLWFPLVSSLQDLLFAVKWLQRLPFLICIVWMHLFLFIFSFGATAKGSVMRKMWMYLRAVILATTEGFKFSFLETRWSWNHSAGEEIVTEVLQVFEAPGTFAFYVFNDILLVWMNVLGF